MAKRETMPTGVHKRTDGRYEKRFTRNGKRYSVYGKTVKECIQNADNLLEMIIKGEYIPNSYVSLDGYFDEWIKRKSVTIKRNSIHNYTVTYDKNIRGDIGKRKIQDIEKREIESFKIKVYNDGKDAKKCNRLLLILNMIFTDAVSDGIITQNPTSNVKRVKEQKKKAIETTHRALTKEEQKAFMEECRNNYYYEFFAILLCTGMRQGELSALTWGDVDYKKNVIHINKTITKSETGKHVVGETPKSTASIRDIPLTKDTKELLEKWKQKNGNVVPLKQATIFTSIHGRILKNDTLNYNIKSVISVLETKGVYIDKFTCHAFRDTFATRFIEQGGTPQTLKTILGHSNLAMTMDLYAHVLPDTKQAEMEKLQFII